MYVIISHLPCKHELLTVSKTTSSSLRAHIPLPGKPFHRQNILENYQNNLLASFSVGKHSGIDHFQNPIKVVDMIHQLLVRELHYHLVGVFFAFFRVSLNASERVSFPFLSLNIFLLSSGHFRPKTRYKKATSCSLDLHCCDNTFGSMNFDPMSSSNVLNVM